MENTVMISINMFQEFDFDGQFPLSMFGDRHKTVITRGATVRESYNRATENWERGQTITIYNFLPIWAKKKRI